MEIGKSEFVAKPQFLFNYFSNLIFNNFEKKSSISLTLSKVCGFSSKMNQTSTPLLSLELEMNRSTSL